MTDLEYAYMSYAKLMTMCQEVGWYPHIELTITKMQNGEWPTRKEMIDRLKELGD